MSYDLVIQNGQIVTPEGIFGGSIAIEEGRIAELSERSLTGLETLDAGGQLILPGVVDLHVHFSEPGRAHWEGWAHGSRAAAAGGVTTVVEMPLNAIPATTNVTALEAKLAAAQHQSVVDYALWGGLVDNNLADLEALAQTGVIGFKAFMVDIKDESFRFVEGQVLREGMHRIARAGHFLAVHAEDNGQAWQRTLDMQEVGRLDRRAWGQARSPEVELEAIRTALGLAQQTNCPLHVVHVSIPEGVDALNTARRQGQKVTLETCAHYLTLSDDDLVQQGPECKCAPPLRDKVRQEALWDQVLAGEIDCITSDHS
nr:allantoinase AllB [Thermaceae bacterium]